MIRSKGSIHPYQVPHLVDGLDVGKCKYIPLDYIPNKICVYTRICQGIRVCQCCDWSWIITSSKMLTQVLTSRLHDVADIQADFSYSVSVGSKNRTTELQHDSGHVRYTLAENSSENSSMKWKPL